jgi:uncharacterized protein with von Willebrand factor type A (vWA) domain
MYNPQSTDCFMASMAGDTLDGCNALVLLTDGRHDDQQQKSLQALLKQPMIQLSS